jgi:hypothetical protein
MKHAQPTRAWRPARVQHDRRASLGVLSALAFNLCMLTLPLASAAAVIVIGRDHLYAYEYSDAGGRVISARVERLNGELIQLDFDRQRQWDNLVAMELNAGDASAARGFLLSARGMLPARIAGVLNRAAAQDAGDAAIEVAALELLTPPTRSRYEAVVPLLSRQPAGEARQTSLPQAPTLADPRDFELMAGALLADAETDPLQFILTGYSLGLVNGAGSDPDVIEGASVLLAASRRDDYPHAFAAEIQALMNEAVSIQAFRSAALASASFEQAAAYANSSAAFHAAVDPERARRARSVLTEIGRASQATSPAAAATLLTHAISLRDVPRLRIIAQAAGDRAAAAAKRLPRDGRLLEAARGELTINRDLAIALAVGAAALAGLVLILLLKLIHAARQAWRRFQDDDHGGELVDLSASNWRPL